ncbi:hypothetical protein HMPREF1322_1596 [Porphyromonas gingivalis W50]|nr:hypothetical protein HMPREF1322_1596 [Porphyromonas gingivalis W50]
MKLCCGYALATAYKTGIVIATSPIADKRTIRYRAMGERQKGKKRGNGSCP